MNFVPCLTWVRKGVAKETPEKLQLTKAELQQLIEETRKELAETELDEDETKADETVADEADDFAKRYNLDAYDDEEKDVPLAGLAQMAVFATNEEDPLMTLQDEGEGSDEDEDYRIKPSDNLIALGHVESDSSVLEIYVYNEDEAHLYIHHDIVLPAFPMAMEWLSFHPSDEGVGNYLAIGDMTSVIRIWDLDLVDALEPACKLGKKFKKKNQGEHVGHKDAVLSLAWNQSIRHVLASGSADESVMLWDLNVCQPANTLNHHQDKVQSMEFHPFESSMLLTGSCDCSTVLTDCRTEADFKKWTFEAEVEKILWNHFEPFYYLVATEDGMVHYVDVRVGEKVFSISAHHKAVTGMALSSQCPGCLITVSMDGKLKVWDITDNKPQFIIEKNPKLGALYCLEASPDYPFVIAMGGDKRSDNFKVWDIRQSAAARNRFGERPLKTAAPPGGVESVNMDSAEGVVQDELPAEDVTNNGVKRKQKKKKKIKN